MNYIYIFRGNKLSERGYIELADKYTSFMAYSFGYPDKHRYSALYEDRAFSNFCRSSGRIMKYLFISIAFDILILFIIAFFQQ